MEKESIEKLNPSAISSGFPSPPNDKTLRNKTFAALVGHRYNSRDDYALFPAGNAGDLDG